MLFNRLILGVLSMATIAFIVYCIVELFGQNSFDLRYTPKRLVELIENNDSLNNGEADIIPPGLPIRVAVGPVISPETSLVLYQWLVYYLSAGLDRKAFLIQR